MSDTPTTPVTAKDASGKEHSFLMTFGAKRRIMRRLRALQIRGELDADLGKIEAIDNLELAYITLWECRQTLTKLSEDDYLAQFEDTALAGAANELWTKYRTDRPTSPEPEAASQPRETTTSNASASGAAG